jgi:hypothetical protein
MHQNVNAMRKTSSTNLVFINPDKYFFLGDVMPLEDKDNMDRCLSMFNIKPTAKSFRPDSLRVNIW